MRRGRGDYLKFILWLGDNGGNKTGCLILLNPLVFHAVAKTNLVKLLSSSSNKSIVSNAFGRNALHNADF